MVVENHNVPVLKITRHFWIDFNGLRVSCDPEGDHRSTTHLSQVSQTSFPKIH
jgi:hypothetical protein